MRAFSSWIYVKYSKKYLLEGVARRFCEVPALIACQAFLGWIYVKCSRKAVVGGVCEAFFREVPTLIACVKRFPALSFKMLAIFYRRLYRHSCKKRRQMLFGNARIKYLHTASIQIFPQPVSCKASAARTNVRARVDWKRQSAFVKCSHECSRKCSHRGSRRCSHRHCINASIDWVWSACAGFSQNFVLFTRNGYVKCRFKEYGSALLQKCLQKNACVPRFAWVFLQDVIPRVLWKRARLNDREWQGRKVINRGKRRFHIVFSQEDPIFRFRLFDSRRFRSHLFLFSQEFTSKRH